MLLARPRPDPAPAIRAFWRWWADGPAVRALTGDAARDELLAEITLRVRAIDPDLQWEWAPGPTARHALVVSAGGEPRLRATAERWRAAAPAPDRSWEFHSSRPANPALASGSLRVGATELTLRDLRFGLREDTRRYQLAVTAFHPLFPTVSRRQREQVTFLAVDWAVGESRAGIWLASVVAGTRAPGSARTAAELADAVAELEKRHAGGTWMMSHHGRWVSLIQVPLRPARWPRFDTHVEVRVAYPDRDRDGLPGPASVPFLRARQDRLTTAAGADGELVAHETGAGRRRLHFYVDGATDAAVRLRGAAAEWAPEPAGTGSRYDPELRRVAHLWAR